MSYMQASNPPRVMPRDIFLNGRHDNLANLGGLPTLGINPAIDTNNFLVVELLHIISTIPIGLGWIQWLSHFVWHCLIVSSVNFLIKYVDLRFLTAFWQKVCITAFSWLPLLLGYKVKNYQIMDLVYGGGCYSNTALETEFHEKLAKYLRISQPFSFTSYYYYTNQTDQNLNYTPPRPRIILHYSKKSIFPLILHGSNTSGAGGTNTEFTLYYPNTAVMNEIEEIQIKKLDGRGKETVYFNVLDFKNNVLSINLMISNPLIPIKNYQKLDEIIGRFTKIQNCLGYKNVNAISIDGCPGLGKTSFIDYFSNKHRGDYHIYYIDMIKNYKTSFETIFNTIQIKLDDFNKNEYPDGSKGSSGIVLMIDELDKYLDMHLEYLHNKKQIEKQKEKTEVSEDEPQNETVQSKHGVIRKRGLRRERPQRQSQQREFTYELCVDCLASFHDHSDRIYCDLCGKPMHKNPLSCGNSGHRHMSQPGLGCVERCQKCSLPEQWDLHQRHRNINQGFGDPANVLNQTQQDNQNLFMAGVAGEYMPTHFYEPGSMQEQLLLNSTEEKIFPQHPQWQLPKETRSFDLPPVVTKTTEFLLNPAQTENRHEEREDLLHDAKLSDVRLKQDEDLGRSGRYLKKELLYKLFELVNMKVNQPSYLIFCTNNFSSLWSDLSEKHFRHLKALHSRFIKIHFDHINKENLIEILDDINKTFSKKSLDENYLEQEEFNKLMELIPENLSMTVREMHHTLIRTMYDIEQFVNIVVGERQRGETSSHEDGNSENSN
jgi:hypothetical protein